MKEIQPNLSQDLDSLVAVPVLPAVEGVGMVAVSQILAVKHSAAVGQGGGASLWGLGGAGGGVLARPGAAVNIVPVGTPLVHLVDGV